MSRWYKTDDEKRGYRDREESGRYSPYPYGESRDYRDGWDEREREERRAIERREEERAAEEAEERRIARARAEREREQERAEEVAPAHVERTSPNCRPCPACPDGNEWSTDGPTGRACPTCAGFAVVKLDGAPFTPAEFHGERDA